MTLMRPFVSLPQAPQEYSMQDQNALRRALAQALDSVTNVTGNQSTALTGDVTGSGTASIIATIADDSVTYAKMQNVSAASRVLGRGSAGGAGNVEELTLGTGLSLTGTVLSSTATGDVVGPASSTDNAIARFDLTTGKLLQDSAVTIGDSGQMAINAGAADDALVVTSTFNGYQAKFRYDASNRFEIGVTATGNTTLRSVGTSPSVNFIAGAAGTAALNFLTGTLSYFTGTSAVVYESTNANQVQVKYDASNYLQLGVSAAGAVTFNAVGSSAGFAFSDSVNFTAQQSLNFVIENRTSDPGSPAVGQLWLRTDL